MRRKDLSTLILDDYFEKVKTYTKEAVATMYGIGTIVLLWWLWWWLPDSEGQTETVEIEKEKEITKKLSETKNKFKIFFKNGENLNFSEDTLDIYLPPEKINKFTFYINSNTMADVSQEVELGIYNDSESIYVLEAVIKRAEVIELENEYKYDIVANFDTAAKVASAKGILTYFKMNS